LILPHRFPCRLVDRVVGERAVTRLTAGAAWLRGGDALPVGLVVEAVAQSAALLLVPAGAPERRLSLAVVEDAVLEEACGPGETLEVTVTVEARWGALVRVRGEIRSDGRPRGRATLVLSGT
jgi:hypothetical protein